jgi:hypothetical protein
MYPPSCETTRHTAVIEESTDGMILGPEDLNYQIYEVSGNLCSFIDELRIHYPMVSPYHSYKTYGIDLFPLL